MEILTVIKYNNWILCERPSREGEKILPIQPHVPVTNQIEADLFRDGRFKRIVSAMQPILYKGVFRVGPCTRGLLASTPDWPPEGTRQSSVAQILPLLATGREG